MMELLQNLRTLWMVCMLVKILLFLFCLNFYNWFFSSRFTKWTNLWQISSYCKEEKEFEKKELKKETTLIWFLYCVLTKWYVLSDLNLIYSITVFVWTNNNDYEIHSIGQIYYINYINIFCVICRCK